MANLHPVPAEWAARAFVDAEGYGARYRRSIDEPEAFWREESARLDWIRPWKTLNRCSFDRQDFGIEWFADGTLNVSANCLDRHLAEHGESVAIIWEGDDPGEQRRDGWLWHRRLESGPRHGRALRRAGSWSPAAD